MTKLSAFWKNHRLGMFYGFLWFFVIMSIFGLFVPRKNAFELKHMIVTLTCCLATGAIITSCFKKWLKGEKGFFPWAMLSQAMGASLFGLFIGQAEFILSLPQLYDGPVLTHPSLKEWLVTLTLALSFPLASFLSIFVVFFLPLSCLNTWHLWKVVNRHPHGADLQGHVA
jgi:hypothetical protein